MGSSRKTCLSFLIGYLALAAAFAGLAYGFGIPRMLIEGTTPALIVHVIVLVTAFALAFLVGSVSWFVASNFMVKGEMPSTWTTETPAIAGWYCVQWEPPDPVPDLVWIDPVNGTWSYDGPDDEDPMAIDESSTTSSTLWKPR